MMKLCKFHLKVDFARPGSGAQTPAPALAAMVLAWFLVSGTCGRAAAASNTVRGNDGAEMVLVPAGPFIFGDDHGLPDEKPSRKIFVKSFYIDRYEVSNAQYRRFLAWVKVHTDKTAAHPDQPKNKDHTPRYYKPFRPAILDKTGMAILQPFDEKTFTKDNFPVVGIDWFDAYAYARYAGKRLPEEMEWEKAARGTDGRNWPWGNVFDFSRCAAGGYQQRGRVPAQKDVSPYIYAAPVTDYPSGVSVFGCFNMAGNVAEWVNNIYMPGHKISADSEKSKLHMTDTTVERVVKGGGSDS